MIFGLFIKNTLPDFDSNQDGFVYNNDHSLNLMYNMRYELPKYAVRHIQHIYPGDLLFKNYNASMSSSKEP